MKIIVSALLSRMDLVPQPTDCSLVNRSLSALALCSVPTCSKVLRRPHLTACCGQNICITCKDTAKRQCPIPDCGSELFQALPNRAHTKTVLEYDVVCGNKEKGCKWQGQFGKFDAHLRECIFAQVKCEFCGALVESRNLKTHHESCSEYPVQCENGCQMKVTRGELGAHKDVCRLQKVQCPFVSYKCCTLMDVRRMDLDKHFTSDFSVHWKAMKEFERTLKANWNGQIKRLTVKQEKILAANDKEIAELKEELKDMTEHAYVLNAHLQKMEESIVKFREENKKAKVKFDTEVGVTKQQQIDRLKGVTNTIHNETKLKCHGPSLPRPRTIVSRPTPPTGERFNTPPFDITIDNFKQRRENNEIWLSPPLFSHKGGYKLCIEVYPNGTGEGYLTFLTIFVLLMKGENDHRLRWPFSGKVDISLLTKFNVPAPATKQSINFNRNTSLNCRKRVTDGIFGGSWGIHKFAYQPTIEKFVLNGALKLRINIQVD